MNTSPHEADYIPVVDQVRVLSVIPNTHIELFQKIDRRSPPQHVLFDFDGTLSLIREGWPAVMVPMMVEALQSTGTNETPEQLHRIVEDFVMELNGKQTIYQMIRLTEEVRKRGGKPEEPLVYKQRYHDLLMEKIAGRRDALRSGKAAPEQMLVPYSLQMLDALQERGVQLYVASGTDRKYVIEEAALLGLDRYFGDHIYGALDDFENFSKRMVIDQILRENDIDGRYLLGFGDGYVEIENIKSSGGIAVAVASDESARSGKPDPWKRERLVGVGADMVIPDFQDYNTLLKYLWNEN